MLELLRVGDDRVVLGKGVGFGRAASSVTLPVQRADEQLSTSLCMYTSVDLSIKWTHRRVNTTLQWNRSLRQTVCYPQTGNKIK